MQDLVSKCVVDVSVGSTIVWKSQEWLLVDAVHCISAARLEQECVICNVASGQLRMIDKFAVVDIAKETKNA